MKKRGNTVTKTTRQIFKDNICTVFNLLNFLIAIALAAVMRNGERMRVAPEDVLKGDMLLLESGNVICADSVVESGMVEVNESILTGESDPVIKRKEDRLLSGSSVILGKCRAEVFHSSEENYASKIVNEMKKYKSSESELLSSMKKVTRFTSFLIVPLGIIMFLEAYFLRNSSIYDAVVSSSAGLLGMLPKGLVLLISIGLAVGVIRLSKKKVLVQDLYSLENLAHCDILCLDKTGTLTEGRMCVEQAEPLGGEDNGKLFKYISSYINNTEDNNATFQALRDYFKDGECFNAVSSIPFSSERKWSGITLENGEVFVLGAFEKLSCGKEMQENFKSEMGKGKRVLFAGITDKINNNELAAERVKLIGAVVISDPIRKNAKSTIKYFYKQGVSVKIISGDNPITASAVAQGAGIRGAEKYIDMSKVEDKDLETAAREYTVFGRVSPKQKKQLVSAMQKNGHNVAMTGDGVNDLLAMKQSDCSIAMGQGSDAARQTAQLVLLNSDFFVLRDVISEGRRVINNITKSAGVFFIKTIYSILISILCVLFNIPFPFIPIQITLIDAVIEAFPAFFMSFEKNDNKIKGRFLSSAAGNAFPNATAITICCLALFVLSPALGTDPEQRTLLMYLTVGAVSLAGVIRASRPFNRLRAFLCTASIVGFAASIVLFSPLLKLPAPESGTVWILAVSVILGVIISAALRAAGAYINYRKRG